MGIGKTARLIPEGILLPCAVVADLHDAGRGVDAFALLEDGDEQFPHVVGAAFELRLLPGLDGIEDEEILGAVEGLVRQGDKIRPDLARLVIVNPENSLVARIRNLLRILGELDLRNKFPFLIQHGRQLVDAAEGGTVAGGDHIRADAPGGDGRALALQAGDQVLVQVAGGGDDRVWEAGLVQHFAGLLGHVGQVAAVQTDTVEGQRNSGLTHLRKDADGVGDAGFQRIVGVHQQDAGVRVELGIFLESRVLVREAHDPAVGVGALDGDVEELSGQHVGGADTAADHGGAGPVDAGVRSLGPAEAKFHDAVALRRVDDPGGFGGDEALVVYDGEDRRLHKLRFHNRGDDLKKGLPRKYDGAFRNRVDVAGEPEIAQVLQKILIEELQASQILNVAGLEGQVLDIVDDLVEAGRDGEAAAGGIFPVKDVEDDGFIGLVLKVALHHGQLVEVCQQGQSHGAHSFHALFQPEIRQLYFLKDSIFSAK